MTRIYRIYLGWNDVTHKYEGYRLIEEDEWDEFYKEIILDNVSLERIFLYLDLCGSRNLLEAREHWEDNLKNNC